MWLIEKEEEHEVSRLSIQREEEWVGRIDVRRRGKPGLFSRIRSPPSGFSDGLRRSLFPLDELILTAVLRLLDSELPETLLLMDRSWWVSVEGKKEGGGELSKGNPACHPSAFVPSQPSFFLSIPMIPIFSSLPPLEGVLNSAIRSQRSLEGVMGWEGKSRC